MILAGDIGGTNTRLALFDAPPPAKPVAVEIFSSVEHSGLAPLVDSIVGDAGARVTHASFGVAGPVASGRVDGVNLAWDVDAQEIADHLGLRTVGLLNDLEANAWGISALGADDFAVLNQGQPLEGGNAAVISAGTGLGEAGLVWDGSRYVPFATEGGHADFAPRSEQEAALWRFLGGAGEHVSIERVCSGMGLLNIYEFLLASSGALESSAVAAARRTGDAPVRISEAAVDGSDAIAVRALEMMVGIYGAAAGNLALTTMATAGVYIGGGIAPKILTVIERGGFMEAFRSKGRMRALLDDVPVRVILNELTALYGAALHAAGGQPPRGA